MQAFSQGLNEQQQHQSPVKKGTLLPEFPTLVTEISSIQERLTLFAICPHKNSIMFYFLVLTIMLVFVL
jgi:hypothetical protein